MSVASVGYAPASQAPYPADIRPQVIRPYDVSEKKVKPQPIKTAAADLERFGNAFNKKLRFVVDHNSNQVIVKVIDKDTDKVIKELPPEELQRLHSNLKEAIGLLFDEMV